MDLFGLGPHEFYHAVPPTEEQKAAMRAQTPPWRKKRSNLPLHLKLATFWRCDLIEPSTREEILEVNFLRPRTARQQLKIDIYAARGLYKCFGTRTIESLARVIKSQTHLRGKEYVSSMLLESLAAPSQVAHVQAMFECLLSDKAMTEATSSWNSMHPLVSTVNQICANETATRKANDLAQSEENKAMIAELRRQQEEHLHHQQRKLSLVHMPTTFFNAGNSTDAVQKDADDNALDDLLFDESETEEEVNATSDYGLSMQDARELEFDEGAMATAAAYRLACRKYKTVPFNRLIKQFSEDNLNAENMYLQHLNIQAFAEIIPHLNHLHVLTLARNNLKHDGGMVLARAMVEQFRRMQHLDISDNGLGSEAGCALSGAFFFMHALRTLNLSKNCMDDTVLASLSGVLVGIKSKSFDLDLSYNDFTCAGMADLARYVSTPTCCLRKLNLEWNQIGPLGCQHLSTAILHNSRMTALNLNFNKIGCDGFSTLVEVFLYNGHLNDVELAHNNIKADSGYMFSQALKLCVKMEVLTHLNLSDNPLSLPVANEIMRTVDNHRKSSSDKPDIVINLHNTFSTAVDHDTCEVADLDAAKVDLLLEDRKQHCFAEIVRSRILWDASRLVHGHEGRKQVTMASLQKPFGRHGTVSLKVDNSRLAVVQGEADRVKQPNTNRAHHGPLNLLLDVSIPEQKEVAVSHLITHLEKRMGADPKNMSNAVHMETASDEQNMVARHPLHNGKPFPHTRDWFALVHKGVITYELNESALKLYATVKVDMASLTNRLAAEGMIRRVVDDYLSSDYIHKCLWNGTIVDAEKMCSEENYFENLESEKKSNAAAATDKDESHRNAPPRRPMKPLLKSLHLPKKGVLEIQIHSDHPVCLLAEHVDLDLKILEDRNLAYYYFWRSRSVAGEGMLDFLLDGRKRPKEANDPDFVFPEGSEKVSFIYIVTRPNCGLVAGKPGRSATIAQRDLVKLDLSMERDYQRALLLRKLCLGENTSVRSVWKNTVLRKRAGQREGEQFIVWGKIVNESLWSIPREGVLEFTFVPCIRRNVRVNTGWVGNMVQVLKGCATDLARADVLRNIKKHKYGLKTGQLRILLNCIESKETKRECFGVVVGQVEDILDGLADLAVEVGYEGTTKHLSMQMQQNITIVQSPRVEREKKEKKGRKGGGEAGGGGLKEEGGGGDGDGDGGGDKEDGERGAEPTEGGSGPASRKLNLKKKTQKKKGKKKKKH
jgi:hypothetical protein